MKPITPFLWFDSNAEEAVNFYLSVFKNSVILERAYYGKNDFKPEGSLMTIDFELNNQRFTAINGGPMFRFTEAISFVIPCETQDEIDYFWEKLSFGGTVQNCGWLKDRFGVSWQIVPANLSQLINNKDREASQRAMDALLKMLKLDIGVLTEAFNFSGK